MLHIRRPGLWVALALVLLLILGAVRWSLGMELSASIRRGNLARVKELDREGAGIRAASVNRTTPLMVAADAGDAAYVRSLLARGADPNAENSDGHNALYWAAAAGRLECVRVLADAGAHLKPGGPAALEWDTPRAAAARAGYGVVARYLAHRERLSRRLLHETQQEWEAGGAKRPLDPNRLDRWRTLIEQGASPNWNDVNGSSLMAVVMAGDDPAVRMMLGYHAEPRTSGRWDADLMCDAARSLKPDTLADLLAHGAPLEGTESWETPLGNAVLFHRLDNAELLFQHGADPSRRYRRESLTRVAKEKGWADAAAWLRKHGARE